jgi:hypothetical protein
MREYRSEEFLIAAPDHEHFHDLQTIEEAVGARTDELQQITEQLK